MNGASMDWRRAAGRIALRAVVLITTMSCTTIVPGEEPPAQSGRIYPDLSELLVHRSADGELVPISTAAGWAARRRHILEGMQRAMGSLPPPRPEMPLDPRVTRGEPGRGYTRWHLSIASGEGDRIPAHLYLPDGLAAGGRRPAMLALHPTSPLGKRVVAGEGPRPDRGYAVELAQRGYIVVAPDYPSFGELAAHDFAADNHVSGTMKGVVNHRRCVDYLESRPDVDPARIGVIGHSLGGHNALFLGAFDERVAVVVSSCGWTPFHDYQGGDITGWTSERYMPRLRDVYGLDPDRVPFDFYGVVAALAPRGFFTSSPLRDHNFDVAGVMRCIPRARAVWKLLGADDRLLARHPDVGHEFPPATRREAYEFTDRVLDFVPTANVPPRGDADTGDLPGTGGDRFTGPWELEQLRTPPAPVWGRRDGPVSEVFYAGEPYRGRPTRVFAYYGRPAGEGGPFPAMLLVHGGGGRAFREWAGLWAKRGYAALAVDTAGQGPGGERHEHAGPDQSHESKFRPFDGSNVGDVWTYHAVAAVLRGHSLLASFEEVDSNRIGITGISWGGYLTCIVAGLDDRLRVAIPVYGCGFLHENSAWRDILGRMPADQRTRWVAAFDPSRYLAGVRCPILFINGTNDFAYPLDSYRRSYRMVPGPVDLSVRVRLPHGHPQGWAPVEIELFADAVLRDGRPLPRLGNLVIDGGRARARFTAETTVETGELHFATADGPWKDRPWETRPAELAGSEVVATVPPERPLVLYLSVTDERSALVSTEHAVLD